MALWVASSGMRALAQALNAAYDVRETRPWWRVRPVSIALTVALALLIISALLIVLYGGRVRPAVAAIFHAGAAFSVLWWILQWPIALTFVIVAFVMIYRFVPNVSAKRHGQGLPASNYRRRCRRV